MTSLRGERIAVLLFFLTMMGLGGGVWYMRLHYISLFAPQVASYPVTLADSQLLLWSFGVVGLFAALSTTYYLLRFARIWLVVVLLLPSALAIFLSMAVIYAMMVIKGWV